ncbi:MAG: hypothetical protein KJ058_14825, partial [Thermoanaerobaculia bacterium]|nr:hypothetical protein [Thermoanaerobaculia bacterium]
AGLYLATSGLAEPPPAPTAAAAPALAAQELPKIPLRRDIAAHDVWVDKDTCILWVSLKNTGTVRIEATLRYQVFVAGTKVEDQAMGVNRAPGEYFSHQVGTTANPYKLGFEAKEVEYFIDSTNVLTEADEANNRLKKSVRCTKMVAHPLPRP